MTISPPITTLFLDIGGVLLTNGWDHHARRRAAQEFDLDLEELNERHHLTYDTLELGKLSLEDYLDRIVFYKPRNFTRQAFIDFMKAQSQPYPETIELIHKLKSHYGLKVAAVSNESRELTIYRVQKFELDHVIDFYVSSCFVHFRKPDKDIYHLALDVAQAAPEQVVYLDDRPMFIEVARSMGIHAILHQDVETTQKALENLGATFSTHHFSPMMGNAAPVNTMAVHPHNHGHRL